jgi:hypothetical protein
MDFTKFPFEKLLYFIAGIIPGFVVLLIFHRTHPGLFGWFLVLGFLGYKTKLSLVLFVAFVVGYSLTTFLNRFLGAFAGAIGGVVALRPYKPPHTYDVAPWRDPRWRALLKKRLGAEAPKDSALLKEDVYKMKCELVNLQPEQERPFALRALNSEKFNSEMDDAAWAQWYEQYHWRIIVYPKRDYVWHVANGLNFNLRATALIILVSTVAVPNVRHWWCVLPAFLWASLLAAEVYVDLKNAADKWSTLTAQINYLSDKSEGVAASE